MTDHPTHVEELRKALDDLQQAEFEYRQMHERHGPDSPAAQRAWNSMGQAGNHARHLLASKPLRPTDDVRAALAARLQLMLDSQGFAANILLAPSVVEEVVAALSSHFSPPTMRRALDEAVSTIAAVRATALTDEWGEAGKHFYDLCGETLKMTSAALSAQSPPPPSSGEAEAVARARDAEVLESVERLSEAMLNSTYTVEDAEEFAPMVASQTMVRVTYNDLRIVLAHVDRTLSPKADGGESCAVILD